MNTLTLNSYAKLNLYLSVRKKRLDNYHSIETVFERISLCDRVFLKDRVDGRIVCQCRDRSLPVDSSNLAVKAAILLSKKHAPGKGVTIRLAKRIPQGSGMAGGSSNAAAVLLGLNKLWGLGLSVSQLNRIASKIGSDVAFFVHDCSFALATGKGDRVKPLSALKTRVLWHVIVVPRIHVSTPLIYKQWDKLSARKNIDTSRLTRPASGAKLVLLVLRRKGVLDLEHALFNSLEAATINVYPRLDRVRRELAGLGVANILMSGSGSAFFGIVSSRKEAVHFSRQLKKHHRLWHVFVARTV